MTNESIEYVGFWVRVCAALIDSVLVLCVSIPLLVAIDGREYFDVAKTGSSTGAADFLISWVVPAAAVVVFWLYKQATPGKMVFSAKVVDARTGNPLTVRQSIIRYLGYFVSTIPFGLGLIWVAFDSRKQGWHDKLAGTVVIRTRSGKSSPDPVTSVNS